VKLLLVTGIVLSWLLTGCGSIPSGSSINRSAAQNVADSFMADLVANRVDIAIGKMEPGFVEQAGGSAKSEEAIRNLFNYCGKPLDFEFKHDEIGFKIYAGGQKKPMRKFYYASTTTEHPKGVCFFAVEVVPGHAGLYVTSFGPLTLKSGQLPDWLK
jgi:hypothetical protein